MPREASSALLAFIAVSILVGGCSGRGYAPISTSGSLAPSLASSPASNQKLMLFGGNNHTVYLGCLNCSEYATDSLLNKYGPHGSPYSTESIFNHYSQYGSAYSTESSCSQYASDPPVIVDGNGAYYGRLTLNRYAKGIGIGTEYMGWLAAICQQ